MSKDPAFLFYPNDWNGGTMHLSHQQKGAYMDLLVLQFNIGKFTEASAKQVLQSSFDLAWPTIKQKFKNAGDLYWNERLQLEIDKRKAFTESRRINGLHPKKGKTEPEALAQLVEDENRNKEVNVHLETFEQFRKKYPHNKRGAKTEFENFKKKHKDWKEALPLLYPAIENQIKHRKVLESTPGAFVPEWKHITTWINQRCWEEEAGKVAIEPQTHKLLPPQ